MNDPKQGRQSTTPPVSVRRLFFEQLRKSVKYMREAEAISAEYQKDIGTRYENEKLAHVAASEDSNWREAVSFQQYAERLANMYGNAALLEALYAILAEQRRTNDLLEYIKKQAQYDTLLGQKDF